MFRHTVTVIGKTTCGVQSHIREHFDTFQNLHLFVLHTFYYQEERIEPQIFCFHTMFQTSFQKHLAVTHTLIVVFCNTFAVTQCNNDCIVCSCKVDVFDSSCSICRVYDRFSFRTVVYSDTGFDGCFIGCIQCQRYVVKFTLQQFNCPFHQIRAISFCRSDVYIQICSSCIQLLFCSF